MFASCFLQRVIFASNCCLKIALVI